MFAWYRCFSPSSTCRILSEAGLRPLIIEFKPAVTGHSPFCRCSGGQLPHPRPQSGGHFSKLGNCDPNGPRAAVVMWSTFIFHFWSISCSLRFGHKRVVFPQEFSGWCSVNGLEGERALERESPCLVFPAGQGDPCSGLASQPGAAGGSGAGWAPGHAARGQTQNPFI